VYYNLKRLHSKLGYRLPEAYEIKLVAYWSVWEIGTRSAFKRDFKNTVI
jgi:hypothetical protein